MGEEEEELLVRCLWAGRQGGRVEGEGVLKSS